jgi:hypothetical protein
VAAHFGVAEAAIAAARQESLVWALERGSRSGRVAYQFAKDYAGGPVRRAPDGLVSERGPSLSVDGIDRGDARWTSRWAC